MLVLVVPSCSRLRNVSTALFSPTIWSYHISNTDCTRCLYIFCVEQQMRYQNVGLSNGHCLGTITIFQLNLSDLFCACAVGILLYCKYYWTN